MDLGLRDRAAVVTGGSRGIGLAIARGLSAEGARVAIVARGEAQVAEAVRDVTSRGGVAVPVLADVATSEGAARALAEAHAALGPLDVLVNNAGGSLGQGAFDAVDEDGWRRSLDLNLMSAVWCSRAFLASASERVRVIVNVSSICGIEYCTSAAYTAAKGAMMALTKEMGVDLAKRRVRVVAVAPGSILFPGGSWDRRRTTHPDRIAQMLKEELPWERFGTPEEVADVVVFACSERASWVTGSTIVVDGGQSRAV